ncbi:MAG: flotillin domain-containing protein [Hoeflea sp.]|uniref:flotillin family protein n=1 Tax=Hoeflea sp. TaxID=1940281 RepID=UPI00272F74CD|nr:flotillin domain-containing protein [Hoeflea sp.]MDP2119014.1 flotillin domain-containing protein [Hoeflea sp.]MDZ7603416.1 flotillin domain-containing protein [Hoeflea sp.]
MVWFFSLLALFLLLILAIWFLQRYYAKATLETALVRTGLGGRRVIIDGGCFALPILHQIQRVSMGSVTFPAQRKGRESLLTKDQLRADIEMEFELRVQPTPEGIATAAQVLGSRIARGGDAVREVVGGALINAMQDAAARRNLAEIHLDRSGYTSEVTHSVAEHAARLGLTMVSVSLVSVDQSDLSQLNEGNAFNAQGMRRLAEMVAEQRKARVQIETETEIAIRESRLAQHQRQLALQRAEREADIAQQEHLDRMQSEARARSDQAEAQAEFTSEAARIEKAQRVKAAQVANDEALRRAEMAAVLALEETRIDNEVQLAKRRIEEASTKAAEEDARAQVLLAAERVQVQKERAIAEREEEISALRQRKDIALEDQRVQSDVATMLARAKAEAAVARTVAESQQLRMEAEAAGRNALNQAENTLSDAVIRMRLEERKLDRMPEIMTQMMKPVEKIGSIRINQISGLGGGTGGTGAGVDSAFGAAMDQILGMAVRLPAMKQMGEEIGLDFDANLAGRTADYAHRTKQKDKD